MDGWAYEHLTYAIQDVPSAGDVWRAGRTGIGYCGSPAPGDYRHVHLSRNDDWTWVNGFLVQNTPYNVFQDLCFGGLEYDYPILTEVEAYTGVVLVLYLRQTSALHRS